jgi:hypothetical protein
MAACESVSQSSQPASRAYVRARLPARWPVTVTATPTISHSSPRYHDDVRVRALRAVCVCLFVLVQRRQAGRVEMDGVGLRMPFASQLASSRPGKQSAFFLMSFGMVGTFFRFWSRRCCHSMPTITCAVL